MVLMLLNIEFGMGSLMATFLERVAHSSNFYLSICWISYLAFWFQMRDFCSGPEVIKLFHAQLS